MRYTNTRIHQLITFAIAILLVFLLTGCKTKSNGEPADQTKCNFTWEECEEYSSNDDYISAVQGFVTNEEEKIYQALPYDNGYLFLSYPLNTEAHDEVWRLYYVEQGGEPKLLDSSMALNTQRLPKISFNGDYPVYVHEVIDEENEVGYIVKCLKGTNVEILEKEFGKALAETSVETYGSWYAFVVKNNEEEQIKTGNLEGDRKTIAFEKGQKLVVYDIAEEMLYYVTEEGGKTQRLYAKNLNHGKSYTERLEMNFSELCGGETQTAIGRSGDDLFYITWNAENESCNIEPIPSDLRGVKIMSQDVKKSKFYIQSDSGTFILCIENK